MAIVLVGDPYTAKLLAEVAARAAQPCVDLSRDWYELRDAARVTRLLEHVGDVAVIASHHAAHVAHALSLLASIDAHHIVHASRYGLRTTEKDDEAALDEMARVFTRYAGLHGWAPPPLLRMRAGAPDVPGFVRALELARQRTRTHAPSVVLSCAACGSPLSRPVREVAAASPLFCEELVSDEALSAPAHYRRGDGRELGGFTLSSDRYYVHESDWIDPADNGLGMAVTCCGARPDPARGMNLSCACGAVLGDLYTDCCAPQGAHPMIDAVTVT